MALVPAAGFALAFLLMAVYPLTETRFGELLRDIAARRVPTSPGT